MSMGSFGQFQSVDSANGDETCGFCLPKDQIAESLWNKMSLEQPTVPYSGESRYLTPLWVSGNDKPREKLHQSDSFQFIATGSELRPEEIFSYHQEITRKVKAALKHLTFREQHVLIQFWSPRVVEKHRLLTTINQPFGLGAVVEELCLFRRYSEHNEYLVDKDHEEDCSPPARVFRLGLPEWTSDITNYNPKDFPQHKFAISCNLYGYLALPVFDSTTQLCVGVLELLTSSGYTSCAFEVQQVHKALKTENLTSLQVFDFPITKVSNEWRQDELDKIFGILKDVSDIHNLPLAQAWALSPTSSFVSHENVVEKSCSSFDTRCIGKECMSTTSLPFHVRDLGKWQFMEACRSQHLDKSSSFVGQALLAHGSCYCQDVTELNEEEYPLVHNACKSGLTGCFTIFLHSVQSNCDFVLEFFLPRDMKDGKYVMELVQTLKQSIEVASGFELGATSSIQVVGPHTDPSVNIEPDTISTSSNWMADNFMFQMDSSDSESVLSMATTCDNFTDAGEMSIPGKRGRKRKIDSETDQAVVRMVRVNVTFNEFVKEFPFSIPLILSGILSDLESEVAKRFSLEGKKLKLKYRDNENDLILISIDDDLKSALDTAVSNTINLSCESVHHD